MKIDLLDQFLTRKTFMSRMDFLKEKENLFYLKSNIWTVSFQEAFEKFNFQYTTKKVSNTLKYLCLLT